MRKKMKDESKIMDLSGPKPWGKSPKKSEPDDRPGKAKSGNPAMHKEKERRNKKLSKVMI